LGKRVWSTHLRTIIDPTIVRAPPVAQEGIDANMGAKKTETKNMIPIVIAVNPVFPPSTSKC
jgi:hypothetical protein